MAKPTNLYRRGAVYWWRRRLTFAVLEKSTITLSLSLLTKELSIGRARGAAMTMVSERLRMTIHQQISSGKIGPSQARTIYLDAVRRMGSALIEMTGGLTLESDPQLPDNDRALVIVEQFWQAAARAGIRAAPGWSYADKNWPELSDLEKSQLMFAARRTHMKRKFEAAAIEALLEAGCEPTIRNQAMAAKLVAEGRAEAARDALQPGWVERFTAAGLTSDAMIDGVPGSRPPRHADAEEIEFEAKVPQASILVPPSAPDDPNVHASIRTPPPAIDGLFVGLSSHARTLMDMTPVQLAEEHIKEKLGYLDHRQGGKRESKSNVEHTRRQLICAARLLQQSLPPGTPFSSITAEQVKDFDSLLDQVPLSFGKSPNDHLLTLRLQVVGERTASRVAEGKLSLEAVGLSIPTTNKHFRYLQRLRNEVEQLCPDLPTVSYSKYCQPDLKKDRDARVEYTVEQGRAIFSLAPWTGCLAIGDRLGAGDLIFHDALYWVLLLVWYTGARREEICALRVMDVRDEHGIDYLVIPEGKTVNAARLIPIAAELKRLGFLNFVAAMRTAGETLLFPEIQPGRGKRTLGDVFYKIWWIYLKPLIPGLVRGQAMHSCRHMVSTELKALEVFPEFRNDLLGHSGGTGGEGVQRYPKATRLYQLQSLVDKIPVVTDHLPEFEGKSELLPAELRVPRPIRKSRSESEMEV